MTDREGGDVPEPHGPAGHAAMQPLDVAVAAARESDESADHEWPELADSIKRRVRSAIVPSRPVLTWDAHGRRLLDAKGRQATTPSRDLVIHLRRRLRTESHAAADVELTIEDHRLQRLRVDVVARYGGTLSDLLDSVWAVVVRTLVDQVGADPDFDAERDVHVRVVDVVDSDPATT